MEEHRKLVDQSEGRCFKYFFRKGFCEGIEQPDRAQKRADGSHKVGLPIPSGYQKGYQAAQNSKRSQKQIALLIESHRITGQPLEKSPHYRKALSAACYKYLEEKKQKQLQQLDRSRIPDKDKSRFTLSWYNGYFAGHEQYDHAWRQARNYSLYPNSAYHAGYIYGFISSQKCSSDIGQAVFKANISKITGQKTTAEKNLDKTLVTRNLEASLKSYFGQMTKRGIRNYLVPEFKHPRKKSMTIKRSKYMTKGI